MNNIKSLNDGDIVILVWSDGSYSLSRWNSNKTDSKPFPVGWYENTDENYWKYIGSKGYE